MQHALLAGPIVEDAADAALALIAVCHGQMGSLEGLTGVEDVVGGGGVDAGVDVVLAVRHGVHAQLEVAAPA